MLPRLILSALLLTTGLMAASAHTALERATPAAGSTVAQAPAQLTLTFTERIEPAFSGATVVSASGQRVDAKAQASGTTLQISLKPLPPGIYKVNWHVMSVDTHKTQGSYSFTVSGH